MASQIVDPMVVGIQEPLGKDEKKEVLHAQGDTASVQEGYGPLPTEEELRTLRRVADKIPWKVYAIAFVELCERFSYYGTTVVCK